MKQVVQNPRTGEVRVVDVPPPQLRRGGALVATASSLISAGTERAKLEFGEKSVLAKAKARPDLARQVLTKARREGVQATYRNVMDRLEAPAALGYSSAGIAVAVAPDCDGIEPGSLVACAGGNYANHAEINFVPKNLLARVPDGVSASQAAYGTLGAIALHGVRQADVRVGECVVVLGLGLVGLLAVQLVRAAGGRACGVDLDPEACSLASRVGAERTTARDEGAESMALALADGAGADAVIICASTPSSDPLDLAGKLCRDRGRVVVVGAVGMTVPRELYYTKELELRLSRSYGPGRYDPAYEEHGHDYPLSYVRWTEQRNMAEFLRLIQTGGVDVDVLTTHRFPVDEANRAYAVIAGKEDTGTRPVGVVLDFPPRADEAERTRIELPPRAPRAARQTVRVGLLGAGGFATRVLLPALVDDGRAELVGVATAGGLSARTAATRFGFRYAAADPLEVINDDEIDAIVIATRHDAHAALTAQALQAGKSVFCEKPLATTWDDLELVSGSYAASDSCLLVGFNRRFSPLVDAVDAALPNGVPRMIVYRVNAGDLPRTHWTKDPVTGGGRIVGEVCHFLDLACRFVEGRPLRVTAETLVTPEPLALRDSVAVHVVFTCGSLASIQYVSTGDASLPKERLEVFCGGRVGIIDDFRRVEIFRDGRRRRLGRAQQKGYREEIDAFLGALTSGDGRALPTEAAFWTSALTLQVLTSLAYGRPARVELPEALGGRGADA